MKYIKLFESHYNFENIINQIKNDGFSYKEFGGDMKISKNGSYVKFFYMKDTYHIIEFNDVSLEKVYDEIGEECYFVSSVSIDNDSPLLIRRFLTYVENFAVEHEIDTICLVAEPFGNKKLSYDKLISLYQRMGFIKFEDISEGVTIMYKNI